MRLSRFRLRVLRRVAPPWALAALIAMTTGATVWRSTAAAERNRRTWGDTLAAVVATKAVAAGDPLDGTNTARRALPRTALAADTITTLPANAVARVALAAGEPVRAERVTGALAGPGTRVVALPVTDATPMLVPGDRVDLYGRAGTPVATDAVVVMAGTERTEIAVGDDAAGLVVAALADAGVTVVLRR